MHLDIPPTASVELRAAAADLEHRAHLALASAVDARKRAEAIDDAPFNPSRVAERESARRRALAEREDWNAAARALSRQRDALLAAATLSAALSAADDAEALLPEDSDALAAVVDSADDAAAHCLAEILPRYSDAERIDAKGGALALAVGDDDARAAAALILRALADALNPRA